MLNTHDIISLEERYKKYKNRKRVKFIFYSLFLILLLLIPVYIFYNNFLITSKSMAKPNKTDKNNTVIIKDKNIFNNKAYKQNLEQQQIDETNIATKIPTSDINKTKKQNLDKNFQKMTLKKNQKADIKIEEKKRKENYISLHIIPQQDNNRYKTFKTKDINLNLSFSNSSRKKEDEKNSKINETSKSNKKIDIVINNIDSIKYLKNRYNNTHNIIFALMLSEEYYNLKRYKKSLKWAIIANDMDNENERSWILFAKSKSKLNQKNDAIKALEAYLKISNSKKVKILLEEIKNGEMND